jgi:hypothetical protein
VNKFRARSGPGQRRGLGSASCNGSFLWTHALSVERPARPGLGGALPYRLERRSKLRAILLVLVVVVVVLVLDLFWGINRSARVTVAARFGRSLTLPP